MINPFTVKKWGALLFTGLFSVICFFVGITWYDFWVSLITMGAGLITALLLSNQLLKNPFTLMLEGKGLIVLNLDSTGIIRPFIVGLKSPYVVGRIGKKNINDVFDRNAVLQMASPKNNKTIAKPTEEGGIEIKLSEKDYNKGRFKLFHYPVLIWNDQIKSLLTKDFFSREEKTAFAEHQMLLMNRKLEELNNAMKNFGRYVVEMTKPKGNPWYQSKWTWVIFLVVILILGFLFAPAIMRAIQGAGGGGNPLEALAGSTITPK